MKAFNLAVFFMVFSFGITANLKADSCVKDSDCLRFHQRQLPMIQNLTVARCIIPRGMNNGECESRGKENGIECTFIENGKRITSAGFKFPCDKGLVCKVVKPKPLIGFAVAKCFKP